MAISTGSGFMAMLEQATKRGHELDSKGWSDTKVGSSLWTPTKPKRDPVWTVPSTPKSKPSVIHSDSLDRDTMAVTAVPGTFDETGTFTAEMYRSAGSRARSAASWDIGTAGTSATTADAFTGTITAEALEALARDISDKTGVSSKEFFEKEYLTSGYSSRKKDEKPLWVKEHKAAAAPSLHGPVLRAVSDPIALPEYLLADLTDQAELGQGSAERGGW